MASNFQMKLLDSLRERDAREVEPHAPLSRAISLVLTDNKAHQTQISNLKARQRADIVATVNDWKPDPQENGRALYGVQCSCPAIGEWTAWRSYSEFAELCTNEGILASMPPKTWVYGSADPAVVEARLMQLPVVLLELCERLRSRELDDSVGCRSTLEFFGAPLDTEPEPDETEPIPNDTVTDIHAMDSSFFGVVIPEKPDAELLSAEVMAAKTEYAGICLEADATLTSQLHVFRMQHRQIAELRASMFLDLIADMRGEWQHESDAGSRAQYCIHCQCSRRGEWTVLRTYSDFERLCTAEGLVDMMPPKWWLHGSASPAVVEARLAQLPDVLTELCSRLQLQCPPPLRLLQFFGAVDLGTDSCQATEQIEELETVAEGADGEEHDTSAEDPEASTGYVYSAASTVTGLASGFASMLPLWQAPDEHQEEQQQEEQHQEPGIEF